MSHDVVENKGRKNVSSVSCHDIDENKQVMESRHDVCEKEGFSSQRSALSFTLSGRQMK
jgi:hypothetical protein